MTRFAIHLETGVVVAITSETKNNYLYQEIEPEIAFAIRDGKVTPKWVIDKIVEKMPRSTLREKVQLEAQLNVRSIDFGLRVAARASADLGENKAVHIELPSEKHAEKPPKGRKGGAQGKEKSNGEQPQQPQQPQQPPSEEEKPNGSADDGATGKGQPGEPGDNPANANSEGAEVVV